MFLTFSVFEWQKKFIMLCLLPILKKSRPKDCTNWHYLIHLQLVICQGPICQINLPALTKPFSNQPLQGILFGVNPSKRQIYFPPQRWMTCQALPQFAYLCSPVKDSRYLLLRKFVYFQGILFQGIFAHLYCIILNANYTLTSKHNHCRTRQSWGKMVFKGWQFPILPSCKAISIMLYWMFIKYII